MQYSYDEYKTFGGEYGRESVDEMYSIDVDSTLAQQFDLIQLNKERRGDVDVTIFNQLLQQYRDEEERNCNLIVNSILKILKKKSQRYIKEKYVKVRISLKRIYSCDLLDGQQCPIRKNISV